MFTPSFPLYFRLFFIFYTLDHKTLKSTWLMSQYPQPFKSVTSFMYFPFKHRVLNFTEPRSYAWFKLDSHASVAKNMICLATEQVVEWPSLLCVYDFNPVFDIVKSKPNSIEMSSSWLHEWNFCQWISCFFQWFSFFLFWMSWLWKHNYGLLSRETSLAFM